MVVFRFILDFSLKIIRFRSFWIYWYAYQKIIKFTTFLSETCKLYNICISSEIIYLIFDKVCLLLNQVYYLELDFGLMYNWSVLFAFTNVLNYPSYLKLYLAIYQVYRLFHKTLPKSCAFINWISVRFYETDCTLI